MKNGYAVVWTGNGPGTAEVQSYHRTQAAAEKRAALILRRIRRAPGQEHCGSFSRCVDEPDPRGHRESNRLAM